MAGMTELNIVNSAKSDIINTDLITGGIQLRIPQLLASKISEKIKDGEYSLKLSHQQYLKHVEGTAQYNQYMNERSKKGFLPQSVLTITEEETQQLIINKAGTGIVMASKQGEMLPIESITTNGIIGKTWSGTNYIETNKARIYYGSRSSHIVPIGGMDYD